VFFNQYLRIREPAVWVASETSKNQQFMQKNQERTGGYLIFEGKNSPFWRIVVIFLDFSSLIFENCSYEA